MKSIKKSKNEVLTIVITSLCMQSALIREASAGPQMTDVLAHGSYAFTPDNAYCSISGVFKQSDGKYYTGSACCEKSVCEGTESKQSILTCANSTTLHSLCESVSETRSGIRCFSKEAKGEAVDQPQLFTKCIGYGSLKFGSDLTDRMEAKVTACKESEKVVRTKELGGVGSPVEVTVQCEIKGRDVARRLCSYPIKTQVDSFSGRTISATRIFSNGRIAKDDNRVCEISCSGYEYDTSKNPSFSDLGINFPCDRALGLVEAEPNNCPASPLNHTDFNGISWFDRDRSVWFRNTPSETAKTPEICENEALAFCTYDLPAFNLDPGYSFGLPMALKVKCVKQ